MFNNLNARKNIRKKVLSIKQRNNKDSRDFAANFLDATN